MLDAPRLSTDANGLATTSAAANSVAGAYPVTAVVTQPPDIVATFVWRNLAGPPHTLTLVSGDGQETAVGTPFGAPLRVAVTDGQDNPVGGVPVLFASSAFGASTQLDAKVVVSDAVTGTAQVEARANATAGASAVQASFGGGAQGVTFRLSNLAGPAAQVVVDPQTTPQTTGVGANFALPLRLQVRDSLGNGVGKVAVSWRLPRAAATAVLYQADVVTDANGYATTLATASASAGNYVVYADAAGVSGPASFVLGQTALGPASLTSPVSTTLRTTVATPFPDPLQLSVQDALGGAVPNVAVQFTLPGHGATAVMAVVATTDDDGAVQVPATANNVAGSYVVTASYPGADRPLVFNMTNEEAAAASLEAESQATPQATPVNQPFLLPLAVLVKDDYGNPVVGEAVQFATATDAAGVRLSADQVRTDGGGSAKVTGIAGATEANTTVTATVVRSGQQLIFRLSSLGSGPDAINVTSGSGQQTEAGENFSRPVRFALRDAAGNAVPASEVTLGVSGATLVFDQNLATTDVNGYVDVLVRAGADLGASRLVVYAAGAGVPAVAQLEVLALPTECTMAPLDATAAAGAPVTVSGQVCARNAPAVGQLQLLIDGDLLASQSLDLSGAATFYFDAPVGEHQVQLRYLAQGPYAGSTSREAFLTAAAVQAFGGGCQAGATGEIGGLLATLVTLRTARRAARVRGGARAAA